MATTAPINAPNTTAKASKTASGLPCPRLYGKESCFPAGQWLVKPRTGSGGAGIHFVGDRRPDQAEEDNGAGQRQRSVDNECRPANLHRLGFRLD